jgi:hypothetical protein
MQGKSLRLLGMISAPFDTDGVRGPNNVASSTHDEASAVFGRLESPPRLLNTNSREVTEVVMAFRNKIYFIVLGIVAQLLFFGDVGARQVEPSDNNTGQEMVTGPEQHEMRLVSFEPWIVEEQIMGTVAAYVYDDVTTERPVDYWEIYNQDGELLAVSWFDSLGVRRTAVDRGIVEEKDELEGIFVVVLDGDLT